MRKIKVLLTGYEVAPFYKRGGLGDVMGSLPKALSGAGVETRVVVPYYEAIREKFDEERAGEFFIRFGQKEEMVGIYKSHIGHENIPVYFLSNRPNLSYINTRGRNKKIDQFAFFDLAASYFIFWLKNNRQWMPNIIHCNDWHTALIPFLLKQRLKIDIPTLLTIHNLAYQGWGSVKVLDLLNVQDEETKTLKRGELTREINLLGEGILHSDYVSTVSPTYAREIGNTGSRDLIYDYIRKRDEKHNSKILGIINGIDDTIWNPETDNLIARQYDVKGFINGKRENKSSLLKELELNDKPTFCFIGRMAGQKGIDLLVKLAKKFAGLDINLILLGSGESSIEKSVLRIAKEYPENIRVQLEYNERMAHKLYAGSDFILIPSYFEPCGLIQMIAMRYGTLPVASKTGGLKDTIKNNINGFLFEKGSSRSLFKAVKKALSIYHNPEKYQRMVNRAMKSDFSWRLSAIRYKKLYREMLNSKHVVLN